MPEARYGELGRVVVDPDADPALIPIQVVDALRDHLAQPLVREILGTDLLRPTARPPLAAGIAEIPDQFLLPGIDRDHRLTVSLEVADPPVDMLKLGVAIGMIVAFLGLAVGLQAISLIPEQCRDGLVTHGMPLAAQFLGQFPRALGSPTQGRLRLPPRRRFDQGKQGAEEGRVAVLDEMPATTRGANALGRQV